MNVLGDTEKRLPEGRRWFRLSMLALTAILLLVAGVEVVATVSAPWWDRLVGHDFTTYRDAAQTWLDTGRFYPAYELSGPFAVIEREILYPPTSILLFAPFTFLPAILWWVIPIGVTTAVIVSWRPQPSGWALIALLLALPITSFSYSATLDMMFNGNPVMWTVMFVALATRFPFFGPFALLKPTPLLLPFSLIGIRSREWWLGSVVVVALSLSFLPLWPDFIRVLQNAQGGGFLYGPASVFPALIPVVAWVSRTTVGSVGSAVSS